MKNHKEKSIYSSISEKNRNILIILIFILIIRKVISKNNSILIKVNEAGKQQVLNRKFSKVPTAFINDTKVEIDNDYYIYVKTKNDIIKFSWNESIDNCSSMFEDLTNIISVDLCDFESSSVTTMEKMFYNCINLIYINFSEFKTENVENMYQLFSHCKHLISLDLTSFDTSKVTNMERLFYCCYELKTLILGEFKNTLTINIKGLFEECVSLNSLDLSNFYTPVVKDMSDMFKNILIQFLDLSSFNTSEVTNMATMFCGCENLESLNLSQFQTNKVVSMHYMFGRCHKLKYLDFKNIDTSSIIDLDLMCYKCYSLIYIDLSNLKNDVNTDSMFKDASLNFSICIKAYWNVPIIMNQINNLGIKNICDNLSCPKEFPYKNSKNVCVEKCTISELQKGKCILNYTNIFNENKTIIDLEQEKLDNIKEQLTGGYFNTSNIDKGEDVVISNEEVGITITISSSDNQKMYRNKNIISINFGKCEDNLKGKYNIPKLASLYILKIDVAQKGMDLPKIEYEVYYPLNNSNLIKLDLDVCKDTKIEFLYPSNMTGNMDLYNASSGYFNDFCYTFTSDKKTDLSLKQRQKDFVEKNKTKCEELCDFIEYDEFNQKVICSCEVKINLPLIKEIKFDVMKLFDKFVDKNNFANIQLLKCYYVLFTKEGISKNIGCFILIPIIILYLICIIKFYLNDYKRLKTIINEIIYAKNNIKKTKPKKKKFR